MKLGNTHIIKFTKKDIKSVRIDSHQWDSWVNISLDSGSIIRSHSLELQDLLLGKHKSYVALCTHRHYWLSNNNGEDFKV